MCLSLNGKHRPNKLSFLGLNSPCRELNTVRRHGSGMWYPTRNYIHD